MKEEHLSIIAREGIVTEESVDPAWAGQNETFDKSFPGDGYIRYIVVRGHETLGDYVEMLSIFVDKTKRRSGTGRLLFEYLEKVVRGLGIKRILIHVVCSDDDPNAFCKFLPAMGYTELSKMFPIGFEWQKKL